MTVQDLSLVVPNLLNFLAKNAINIHYVNVRTGTPPTEVTWPTKKGKIVEIKNLNTKYGVLSCVKVYGNENPNKPIRLEKTYLNMFTK